MFGGFLIASLDAERLPEVLGSEAETLHNQRICLVSRWLRWAALECVENRVRIDNAEADIINRQGVVGRSEGPGMAEAVDHFRFKFAKHRIVVFGSVECLIDRHDKGLIAGVTVNLVFNPATLHSPTEIDTGAKIPPQIKAALNPEHTVGQLVIDDETAASTRTGVPQAVLVSQISQTGQPRTLEAAIGPHPASPIVQFRTVELTRD